MYFLFLYKQGEIEFGEVQQQQEVVEPNWDDIVMTITTQKSNVNI